MDKFEYRNGHILYFVISVIMSVLISMVCSAFRYKMLGKGFVFQLNLYTVFLTIGTIVIMTFFTYNMSHEIETEMIMAYCFSFIIFLFPLSFIAPDVIYIIGVFVATPGFVTSYKPYLVTIDSSEVEFYSFSRKDKEVALAFDQIKKVDIYHMMDGVSVDIYTKERRYYYFFNRRKGERVIETLISSIKPYNAQVIHRYRGKEE